MAQVKEYYKLSKEYFQKYGYKSVLLMQIGKFYEFYGRRDKDNVIDMQHFMEVSRVSGLKRSNGEKVMLGSPVHVIDKYVSVLIDNGYTCIVYDQVDDPNDPSGKKKIRIKQGIYGPGTYFKDNEEVITNNIACVWVYHPSMNSHVIRKNTFKTIGFANVDIITGKLSYDEFTCDLVHQPSSYDRLESLLSCYNPNEIIFISNESSKVLKDIAVFSNSKSAKKLFVSLHKNEGNDEANVFLRDYAKKCDKHTYVYDTLVKFIAPKISEERINNDFCMDLPIMSQSAAFLLNYLHETNSGLINNISVEQDIENNKSLILANHTLKQLNIIDDGNYKGKLSSCSKFLDNNKTPMGRRFFHKKILNPTRNIEKLEKCYSETQAFIDNLDQDQFASVRSILSNCSDIEKINRKIYLNRLSPQDIYDLSTTIDSVKELKEFLTTNTKRRSNKSLRDIINSEYFTQEQDNNVNTLDQHFMTCIKVDECAKLENIQKAEVNIFKKDYSVELDKLEENIKQNESLLDGFQTFFNELLATKHKSRTKNGENSFIKRVVNEKGMNLTTTTLRGKSLIELFAKAKQKSENHFLFKVGEIHKKINIAKIETQSCSSNQVSIKTSILDKCIKEITMDKIKFRKILEETYLSYMNELKEYSERITSISNLIARLDNLQNQRFVAETFNYSRPKIVDLHNGRSYFEATKIRHCLIEQLNTDELYVSNDISMTPDEPSYLLFGTNAVGKTSFIRSIGICVIMAQAGLYVPCSSFVYYPYQYIFSRIIGNDNLFKGQSTFAVEMCELRVILEKMNKNSLVLGDELCSGTEIDSAVGIFTSGIMEMHEKECNFIFATHLHEIVDYDEIKDMCKDKKLQLKHMTVSYDKERDCLIYDRILRDGAGNTMYGLEVCKSLRMPEEFMKKAFSIRKKYNSKLKNVLDRKGSSYNSKKLYGDCELCGAPGEHIHHMIYQSEADDRNIIEDSTNNITFNKNHKANLMCVCEKCHDKIHRENKVFKKFKTTNGYICKEI